MSPREPPLVSIVMPAFNAAPWIGAAIASAQAQTEARLELLIVNDGSTDATAVIAGEAAALDRRVRVLHMPQNSGPAAARNRGLSEARGDWVAVLDADDRFHPGRLEHLLRMANDRGADLVSDNLLLCSVNHGVPDAPMIPPALLPSPRRLSAAEFVERNVGSRRYPRVSFGFMQPIFRAAFLDAHGLRYDERNRFGEDFLLYVACLMCGAEWWITPEPMYMYTVRPGSLTETQTAADLGRIRAVEQHLLADPRIAGKPGLMHALRRHKAAIDRNYHYRAFTDALKAGRLADATSLLLASSESFRCIARESVAQAPIIAVKAWHGGYRRRRAVMSNGAA